MKSVNPKQDFVKLEHEILAFWKERDTFNLLRKKNEGREPWSFLDGPITANNPMGVHHAWGRTLKDVFQRYQAMRGRDERFQNGYDCQGLWVEVGVEKDLGFKNKKDIEAYGIAEFVEKCKERVGKYSRIMTEQSIRLGQWMDWENSYYTMSDENNYAIWHFLKKCFEKGYIYKGHDSVPWCPRCGTAISQHEMLTEDYKEISHKAIYFVLPMIERPGENLLVWTTTPWTIPANVAVAVNPEFDYGCYEKDGIKLVVAVDRAIKVLGKDWRLTSRFKGAELENRHYDGPFDHLPRVAHARTENEQTFHRIVASKDLVTAEEGTGLVHIAPGAGAEDFALGKEKKLPVIDVIDESATYLGDLGEFSGQNAKEHPEIILDYLKSQDRFYFKVESYTHRYPICWRCKDELVWRVVDEWYISMNELRGKMIEVAKKINWIPEFGLDRELDWLNNMHDWLISKKRYWGLALPIWECSCGNFEVLGAKEELEKRAVEGWDEFKNHSPHRPWVDKIRIKCLRCGKLMNRIPDVGNPWLDAGIVPFSTIKYFSDRDYWKKWFPVELVCECFPGQFKNWFYSLIAMSTVLENTNPYKTLLGHALVKDEQGKEMHKSAGNTIWFDEAVEKMGADVMRFMYARQNPVQNMLFGYKTADETRRKLLLLWNVYSFFVTYALIDGFKASGAGLPDSQKLSKLDRWILSELNQLIKTSNARMNEFDTPAVILAAEGFIDKLANWYVRRSRRRFWKSDSDEDKKHAYATLYQVLMALIKTLAPVIPFVSESIYQNLRGAGDPESVHLCDYPRADESLIDQDLRTEFDQILKVVKLARSIREKNNIGVRQPLKELLVFGAPLTEDAEKIVQEELNVKNVKSGAEIERLKLEDLARRKINLDFRALGAVYREKLPKIKQAVEAGEYRIEGNKLIVAELVITDGFYEQWEATLKGYGVTSAEGITAVLRIEITPELKRERIAREIIRVIQDLRKDAGYQVNDRITVGWLAEGEEIKLAVEEHRELIAKETLAQTFVNQKIDDVDGMCPKSWPEIAGEIKLFVKK